MRSVPRVFTERSEVPLVTLNLCVMKAVQSRGRGPGIHTNDYDNIMPTQGWQGQ